MAAWSPTQRRRTMASVRWAGRLSGSMAAMVRQRGSWRESDGSSCATPFRIAMSSAASHGTACTHTGG
eukprot:6404783-Prymnesium_polylepis.1